MHEAIKELEEALNILGDSNKDASEKINRSIEILKITLEESKRNIFSQ